MKGIYQVVFTVFVGVSFLLLSGCPKKVAPIKRTSKVTRRAPPAKPPKLPDASSENGTTNPLKEEEIPRIAKLEESSVLPDKQDTGEKASALQDIYFDLDQSVPRPTDNPVIEKNVNWLIAHPNEKVILEGHGDNRGTNEYNLVLGEKRATSVKNYMVTLGIDASRLTVVSYGEERPFCTREDDDCYKENRRTHFHIQ